MLAVDRIVFYMHVEDRKNKCQEDAKWFINMQSKHAPEASHIAMMF